MLYIIQTTHTSTSEQIYCTHYRVSLLPYTNFPLLIRHLYSVHSPICLRHSSLFTITVPSPVLIHHSAGMFAFRSYSHHFPICCFSGSPSLAIFLFYFPQSHFSVFHHSSTSLVTFLQFCSLSTQSLFSLHGSEISGVEQLLLFLRDFASDPYSLTALPPDLNTLSVSLHYALSSRSRMLALSSKFNSIIAFSFPSRSFSFLS